MRELILVDVETGAETARRYLGSKPITNFMTANNALAGTGGMRQPVHKDITFHHPTCPFYFIANIVLSDFSTENGATEFWLGSHAHTTSSDQVPCTEETKVRRQVPGDPSCNVKPEIVERRRTIRAPIQAQCSKGDIVIRDLRTWHAGMPNESENDRIMIAIGYQVSVPNSAMTYCSDCGRRLGTPTMRRDCFSLSSMRTSSWLMAVSQSRSEPTSWVTMKWTSYGVTTILLLSRLSLSIAGSKQSCRSPRDVLGKVSFECCRPLD